MAIAPAGYLGWKSCRLKCYRNIAQAIRLPAAQFAKRCWLLGDQGVANGVTISGPSRSRETEQYPSSTKSIDEFV